MRRWDEAYAALRSADILTIWNRRNYNFLFDFVHRGVRCREILCLQYKTCRGMVGMMHDPLHILVGTSLPNVVDALTRRKDVVHV